MFIKICGIRRREDCSILNEVRPDYAGFIFAPSKRRVSCGEAALLRVGLDPSIQAVGVFVNEEIVTIVETVANTGLAVVQLHGEEDPNYVSALRRELPEFVQIWKALRVENEVTQDLFRSYTVDAFLLDAFSADAHGGTGKKFNWNNLHRLDSGILQKVIIAGGLDKENLPELFAHFTNAQPLGLDVSSSLETAGFKDGEKLREFMGVVRGYN